MSAARFVIIATRPNGSTVVRADLSATMVAAVVPDLLGAPAEELQRVSIIRQRPAVSYVETSPRLLPLDEALVWRQPDDALTRALR